MEAVTTQKGLDEAKGKWVKIESGSFWVLRGNSHAAFRDNSHAVLWDNSHAELRGNSHAVLRGNSHAVLWDNSHAVLWDNSHAVLRGNSHAVLRGNSHAELWDNSHAVLWDNSHAVLKDFSIVHLLSKETKAIKEGGTIIVPNYPLDIRAWAKLKGLEIKNGKLNLYKCVNLNGTDFYTNTIDYLSCKEITAPDWDREYQQECGHGLHLADSPEGAKYFLQDRDNYILLQVEVDTKDCKPPGGQPQFPMKLRARACKFLKIIEKMENGKSIPI